MPIFMPPDCANAGNGSPATARRAAALPPSMITSRRLILLVMIANLHAVIRLSLNAATASVFPAGQLTPAMRQQHGVRPATGARERRPRTGWVFPAKFLATGKSTRNLHVCMDRGNHHAGLYVEAGKSRWYE